MEPWQRARDLDPVRPAAVVAYLDDLASCLSGPRRVVRGLLREVADHLEDAVDALVAAGYHPDEAAARAIGDFGTVEELAPAYRTTIAVASSRRTAWLLLCALLPQPMLWDQGLQLGTGGEVPQGPLFPVLDTVVEYGGGLIMLGALVAVIATGVGNRWFAAGRRTARRTARFVIAVCVLLPILTGSMVVALGQADSVQQWTLMGLLLFLPLAVAAQSARTSLAAAA